MDALARFFSCTASLDELASSPSGEWVAPSPLDEREIMARYPSQARRVWTPPHSPVDGSSLNSQKVKPLATFPSFNEKDTTLLPSQFCHEVTPQFIKETETKYTESWQQYNSCSNQELDIDLKTNDLDLVLQLVDGCLSKAEIERDRARKEESLVKRGGHIKNEKRFVSKVETKAQQAQQLFLDARAYYIDCLTLTYKGVRCPPVFSAERSAYKLVYRLRLCHLFDPTFADVQQKLDVVIAFFKQQWQSMKRGDQIQDAQYQTNLQELDKLLEMDVLKDLFERKPRLFDLTRSSYHRDFLQRYPHFASQKAFQEKYSTQNLSKAEE